MLVPKHALKLRSLAARMRAHAADTHIELYRRKFESLASELEEEAVTAESRMRPSLRQVS
jgi:predicted ATPase